jgi:hypothetical protein
VFKVSLFYLDKVKVLYLVYSLKVELYQGGHSTLTALTYLSNIKSNISNRKLRLSSFFLTLIRDL